MTVTEYEVYSEREVLGLAWLVISSPEQAAALENKQGVVFPSVDFSKYYLLESQGRKITNPAAEQRGWCSHKVLQSDLIPLVSPQRGGVLNPPLE